MDHLRPGPLQELMLQCRPSSKLMTNSKWKQRRKEEALKITIEKANNKVRGTQLEKQRLQHEIKRQKSEMKVLREQLTILR